MIDGINIKIVDSRNVAQGTGVVAYKAAKYAEEGLSADEIEEKLSELVPKVFTALCWINLTFCAAAEDAPHCRRLRLTSLKLRPEIVAKDGKLIPGGKFRGSMDKVGQKLLCQKA